MSRGLGRIERECLRVIEEADKPLNTFAVTAEVYRIKSDRYSNRLCNDAQHTATKRALSSLRRKGLITGQQDVVVSDDGKMPQKIRRNAALPSGAACGRQRLVTSYGV